MRRISVFGLLCVGMYFAGTLLCRYYSWHCSGTYCSYAIIIPFLPWVLFIEPYVNHSNALFIYSTIALVNSVIIYLTGQGIGWIGKRLFKAIFHVKEPHQ